MNFQTNVIVEGWRRLESRNSNKHVFLDREALKAVARKHASDRFVMHPWREPVYAKNALAFASQEIFANCFNAHFNVFDRPDTKYTVANPDDSARPFTGAFALQSVIYRHFGETIPHACDLEKHVKSDKAMAKFFGGMVPIPSPELKRECGESFVAMLQARYQGNPLNMLEEAITSEFEGGKKALRAFNRGRGLVELLVRNFGEAYSDEQVMNIEGKNIILSFSKRAQLVAVMLHARAADSRGILPMIADINEVGPVADYELPKALRSMGILRYSGELANLVDNWTEIPKDSVAEIEIRAATVAACVELLEELNDLREKIFKKNYLLNICHLDYWLWKMGKDAKHLRPHLTRTSAY